MLFLVVLIAVGLASAEEDRKLSWKEDDGLEIKIVKPIKKEECKEVSKAGDEVLQFYRLTDKDGKEIGSNFGKEPYTFVLGKGRVIAGMDRAMIGMCIGEKRKIVIPGKLGFGVGGRERDNIAKDQILYYTVQLVDIFKPVPGKKWTTDEGITIEVTHKIDEDKCRKSETGDTIHQQYELHLENGTFVDSSFSRNKPFIFQLNQGKVIKGMDIAMTDMCEGERRHVVIPSDYGRQTSYGDEGRLPQIPGKAKLVFDIILEKLIKKDEL
ncbi:peptidyl-prolyl cis-trans isomerase, FKBP-type [Cooperia oncophora]